MLDYNIEKQSLKYTGNVPEGYSNSIIEITFDFIYRVLKRDASIYKAIQGVANEYGLKEDEFTDYLIENKYILNKANRNELSNQIKTYNTKSLKKILKKHGLKTSGKRKRIEQRILENGLIGTEYYLSSKSKVFYRNKKRRIRIFEDYLFDYYYFTEFNDFYMDSYRKKEAKIPVEFIKLHIKKAIEDESHENYLFNTQVMAEHFRKREKHRKMLEYSLKNYCMNLNPIWKIGDLKGHVGIRLDTYDDLMFLKEKLGRNAVINAFYLVWDSFNFENMIVSKYDGYRCLKDILNHKDLDKINSDLDNRFYENENLKIKRITQKTLFDF